MPKPTLTVIQGDATPNSRWLDFPAMVSAKSPFDKLSACAYRIARDDAVKQARAGRRNPVFDFWSCVVGCPPPVPSVVQYNERAGEGLKTLADAHACFQGIERPVGSDHDGANYVTYVLKPAWFYEYQPSPVCVATKAMAPDDLVFVAYEKLDAPAAPARIKGILTHWQFVEADPVDAMMPIDFAARYKERLW